MTVHHAKFSVGQLIVHKLFNYRGIIFDFSLGVRVFPWLIFSLVWYIASILTVLK